MTQNRKLTDLKNIGKKIAGRLNEVGIFSEDDLRRVGAIGAHQMIREHHPNETLPVCYYLYSFEGALHNKYWDEIGETRKQHLQSEIVR
ncbi:MAG: TfoX/Sxy family protein [Deinococcota bacterium]